MPISTNVNQQEKQIDKSFMALTLVSLGPEVALVCDQILSDSEIPTLDDAFLRLLPQKPPAAISSSSIVNNTSILVSHS